MTATRPCRLRVALRSNSGTGPSTVRNDALQSALAREAHGRVALDVVPGCPHRLLEGPRFAALPFEVVAPKIIAQRLPGPASSKCQAPTRSKAGSAGPSPPTSMTPARCPWETSTLPGIRSPWVITSAALRGSARMTAQMRRSRGTSRSCSLRSKQVSIHGSWDRSSPPDPFR
jgi:hypothetical protein